jgi:hypothetical protein
MDINIGAQQDSRYRGARLNEKGRLPVWGGDAPTFKCQSTKVKPLKQFRFPHSKNLIDHMSHCLAPDTGLRHGPHIFRCISYTNPRQAPNNISIFRVETSILGEPPKFQSL